ncbi:4-hydroxybenzoyl-CoA thioesterase family active site [hydrothermal vent metagenome]|uniref:4-hydroxybenzoyl-CoA thioesterase family active site n=1 Tax=hydrothermal vent metagenome TaxID=652676 RepID=A0A1W1EF41_9ZZZZ
MKPYIYTFKVKEEDIDFNGHVNNVVYLSWMIDAATKHGAAVGSGYEKCLEFGGTWVAKSHTIEYKKPSFKDDELQMKTWIEDIGKILSTRRYELRRVSDDALILEGKTEWVFVDSKKMRPMKIPEGVILGFVNS